LVLIGILGNNKKTNYFELGDQYNFEDVPQGFFSQNGLIEMDEAEENVFKMEREVSYSISPIYLKIIK